MDGISCTNKSSLEWDCTILVTLKNELDKTTRNINFNYFVIYASFDGNIKGFKYAHPCYSYQWRTFL